MHGLFWHEFLYQQSLDDRQRAELVVWRECAKGQEEAWMNVVLPTTSAVVNMSHRMHRLFPGDTWGEGYPELMRTVEMAVLPNAQMGLLLRQKEVDAILERGRPSA